MRVRLSTTAIFGDLKGHDSETSEIRPAILYDDMLPLVGLWPADCNMNDLGWPWAAMSTNLQFSRCYIFVSFGNNVDIGLHYDNNPFWICADTNKDDLEILNDLERPIHLKVRLADGTLDVHIMLWLSDLTMKDRTALFPVRSIPRWQPAAILKISIGHSATHDTLHFMYVHRP